MADTKLADLTALTTPSGDDILYIVDDPAGTPLDRKIALDNLFTRGTITADAPVLNMSQTWNNGAVTFTGLKFNAAGTSDANSASASLLMDLQVGGSSKFNVSKAGAATVSGNISNAGSGASFVGGKFGQANGSANFEVSQSIGFTNAANIVTGPFDLFLTRRAAANLRLGAADAAAPVAQTLSVQSVVAGITNTAGTNLTITGSQGTGTGAGGSIIFQVAPAGSTGSAQNALANILELKTNTTIKVYNNIELTASNAGIYNAAANLTLGDTSDNYAVAISGAANKGVTLKSAGVLSWTDGTSFGGTADVILRRDAANTLALRNGNNGQTFRLYGRFTDITNDFERFFIEAPTTSGAAVLLGTQKGATTGAARALEFQTDGTTRMTISTAGNATVTGWFKTNLYFDAPAAALGGNGGVYFGVTGTGAQIQATAVGVIAIANFAGSDFNRLQFGGTTSSFPALKRSSTTLQAVLANDTGFTNIQGKLTTDTAYTAGDPATTGYLVVYDSTGTAYKIPALAV